jgi:hypothetical protein
MRNVPKLLFFKKKIIEIDSDMINPDKIFIAHKDIFRSIPKLDLNLEK